MQIYQTQRRKIAKGNSCTQYTLPSNVWELLKNDPYMYTWQDILKLTKYYKNLGLLQLNTLCIEDVLNLPHKECSLSDWILEVCTLFKTVWEIKAIIHRDYTQISTGIEKGCKKLTVWLVNMICSPFLYIKFGLQWCYDRKHKAFYIFKSNIQRFLVDSSTLFL